MPRNLYDCTATELATQPVEHLSHDTAPAEAVEWLADNGYDAAPVYENGDPVGFLHRGDVTTDMAAKLSLSISPRSQSIT